MNKEKTKEYEVKLKAGVVVYHKRRVLLIRELNRNTNCYKWNIIKGTFEPGKDASILETAIREAKEEANAKIKLKHFLSTYYLLYKQNALMMFTFSAELLNQDVKALPKNIQAKYGEDDIIEVKFFTKQELLRLKPEDFIDTRGYFALHDYLKGKKIPLEIFNVIPILK